MATVAAGTSVAGDAATTAASGTAGATTGVFAEPDDDVRPSMRRAFRHAARLSMRSQREQRYPLSERLPMASSPAAVHSDPQVMGGTPVFVGTRVPFQTLLDYLEAGDPLSEFLDDFPTVSREQAVAALEQAKDALIARANPS